MLRPFQVQIIKRDSPVSIPKTSNELRAEGYEYSNDAICRGCQEEIEWWITPTGHRMPMSVKRIGTVKTGFQEFRESHFATCTEADSFRKSR